MNRLLILVILNVCFVTISFSQSKKGTIYCFPGQGSDERIFDSLLIDTSYILKIINYGTPEKGIGMEDFAKQLSSQIDTNQNFVLVGVSLGGMICTELTEVLNPSKTIIISSAKNSRELPTRYKFQKVIPIYKLFPGRAILAGAKIMQPIVEPDRNNNEETFKSMLSSKNSLYMKRTVELIIKWDRKENTKKIYHIHGEDDHTLPIRKIESPEVVIEKGSHMMTLTRAEEISSAINEILKLSDN